MKPNCECNKESDCRKNKSTCENKIDCNKVEQVVRDLLKENKTIKQQLDAVLKLVARCDLGGCFDLHTNCGCKDKSSSDTNFELIKDVRIVDTTLIITFETSKGDREITFDLSSIFNPNNYYTKIELDNKLMTLLAEAIATGSFDISLDWDSVTNKPNYFNTKWSMIEDAPDISKLLKNTSDVVRIWNIEDTAPMLINEGPYTNTDFNGEVVYISAGSKLYLKVGNTYYRTWNASDTVDGITRLKGNSAYCSAGNKPKHNTLYYRVVNDVLHLYVADDNLNLIELTTSASIDVDSQLSRTSENPVQNKAIWDQLYGDQRNNQAGIFGRVYNLEHPEDDEEVAENYDIIQVDKTNEYKSFYFKENPIVSKKIRVIEDDITKKHLNSSTIYTNIIEIPSGSNITSSSFPDTNTRYIIKGVCVIASPSVSLPNNSSLEFEDTAEFVYNGTLTAPTIKGNNTKIVASRHRIFPRSITIAGTWNVPEVYPEWFDAPGLPSDLWFYKRDLLCYNTAISISGDNDPNVVVKDEQIAARVMYPGDYFPLMGRFAKYKGLPPHYRNIYLVTNSANSFNVFALKESGTYYLVWDGCTNYNTYSEGTTYSAKWGVKNFSGISAKQSVINAKNPDGSFAYYGGVKVLDTITGVGDTSYAFAKRYKVIQNQEIHHIILTEDDFVETYFGENQTINASTRIELGNYSVENIVNGELAKYVKVIARPKPNDTTFTNGSIVLCSPGEVDLEGTYLEFDGFVDASSRLGESGNRTPMLPRGLESLTDFENYYNDETRRPYAYKLGFPYTCADVYYDATNNRFLLNNPFEKDSNGRAVLYTKWNNSDLYNDEFEIEVNGETNTIYKPKTDKLFSNVYHKLAELVDPFDITAEVLAEIENARSLKIYKPENNSLTNIAEDIIEYYGDEQGDIPAIKNAIAMASDKVSLAEEKVYYINSSIRTTNPIFTISNKDTFVFDGNNSILFSTHHAGIHNKDKINGKTKVKRGDSYSSASWKINVEGSPVQYTETRYFPDVWEANMVCKAESKTVGRNPCIFWITDCNNTVIKNIKAAAIKEMSANGSASDEGLSYANHWGSEWRLSASSSIIQFASVRESGNDIIFHNLYLNNYYTLYGSSGDNIRDIYLDRIIYVRGEQGFTPAGNGWGTVSITNCQIGQAPLQGPGGAHLIYQQGACGRIEIRNCHFYVQDNYSTTSLLTFHGSSGHRDVIIQDCLMEGSGGILTAGPSVKSYSVYSSDLYQIYDDYCATSFTYDIDPATGFISNSSGSISKSIPRAMATDGSLISLAGHAKNINIVNCSIHTCAQLIVASSKHSWSTSISNFKSSPAYSTFCKRLNIVDSTIYCDWHNTSKSVIDWFGNVNIEGCKVYAKDVYNFVYLHNDRTVGQPETSAARYANLRNNHIIIDTSVVYNKNTDSLLRICLEGNLIEFVCNAWLASVGSNANTRETDPVQAWVINTASTETRTHGDGITFKDNYVQSAHFYAPNIAWYKYLVPSTTPTFIGVNKIYEVETPDNNPLNSIPTILDLLGNYTDPDSILGRLYALDETHPEELGELGQG